jgi:hypothetical protein
MIVSFVSTKKAKYSTTKETQRGSVCLTSGFLAEANEPAYVRITDEHFPGPFRRVFT